MTDAAPFSDLPDREGRFGLAVAAAFFVGVLGFAAFVRVDAAVYAQGRIEVVGNRQAVQHPDGGVVSALHVNEGQRVRRGQVLVELATPQLIAEEQSLTTQVIALRALRLRLLAERDRLPLSAAPDMAGLLPRDRPEADRAMAGQRQQYRARSQSIDNERSVLGRRRGQLREQIRGYERQLAANVEQQRLIQEELTGIRALAARGYAAQSRVRELERVAAGLEGANGEYRALVARASEAIGETELQVVGLERRRGEEVAEGLRTVDVQLGDLEPRLMSARQRLAGAQIRAPATGQVVGLSVFTVGGVVASGQKLMDVVPKDASLTIVAQVAPSDADDLKIGQTTEVRFTGLENRTLPIMDGRVVGVSADAFVDERNGQPFFRAEIRIPPNEWKRLNRPAMLGRLRPGLPVDVVIPLRNRTMLGYIVEPLRQSLWRSFREH